MLACVRACESVCFQVHTFNHSTTVSTGIIAPKVTLLEVSVSRNTTMAVARACEAWASLILGLFSDGSSIC